MAFIRYIVVVLLVLTYCYGDNICPKKCDCDMNHGLNRAICVYQNIISIDIGVPSAVQVYSLSHNAISELDNFCFKEAGYLSLQVLNLSYNLIFWIGLHAFANLENLVHLDLSNNRLRYIASDLFWDTPNLNYLDLSSNIFETLKNEPFLMHTSLEVLNLNNCRMASLPERLFTRLPNLKKLDLSENFVLTLHTQVLSPLRKLERLELRNNFMKCTQDMIAVESWIIDRGITYQKQCKKLAPKMSEKMISTVIEEKQEVDVNDVWNITKPVVNATEVESISPPLTPLNKFDKEFSAIQAFVIGLEIGLGVGVVGAYIWLTKLCRFGRMNCSSPRIVRQNRRLQRVRDGDMRTGLLWSNMANSDLETPPSFRRQFPLPDFPTYGVPPVREAALQVDAIRLPDRGETPPPAYHECRINI